MDRPTDADVTTRPARASDAQIIVDFNSAMAHETEGRDLDADTIRRGVTRALTDPAKGSYFVAEVGGSVVGSLLVTREWSDWRDGDLWWIQSVYVAPDHRRRGVFRRLYAHVRRAAAAAGAAGLRLYVERDNAAAQATYARLGMDMTHYLVMEEVPLARRGR